MATCGCLGCCPVILELGDCVHSQWPAFEVLQGQKGKQMAAPPGGGEVLPCLVRARAVPALWPPGAPAPPAPPAPGQVALARLVLTEACVVGCELVVWFTIRGTRNVASACRSG